jgi:hypothetical protein
MVEPITTTIATFAIKELGPPIMKETVKAYQERMDERIATISGACKALNAPEVVEKAMVGAVMATSLSSPYLAVTVAIGVIKGVNRYTKS